MESGLRHVIVEVAARAMRVASRMRGQQRMIEVSAFSSFRKNYSLVDSICPKITPLYRPLIVSLTYVDESWKWMSLRI